MDSCFCKQDSRELSPPPSSCHMRAQGEVSSLQPGRDPSPESDHVGTLMLDFQPPKLWEVKFCCISHTIHDTLP